MHIWYSDQRQLAHFGVVLPHTLAELLQARDQLEVVCSCAAVTLIV